MRQGFQKHEARRANNILELINVDLRDPIEQNSIGVQYSKYLW